MTQALPSTEVLWETFHDRLHQFIRAHVADPLTAEDILQTVFLTVHQRSGEVRDATRLTSWLFQLARHAIADTYRQRQTVPLPADAAEHLAAPAAEESDLYEQLIPCLHGLLRCLSADDQAALRLADLAGVSQRELAHQWGLSFSGAKSRVQRARARLKALLIIGCHLELSHAGAPIAFTTACTDCRQTCPSSASFAASPRLWRAHPMDVTSLSVRSPFMTTNDTTTTPAAAPPVMGGFQKPVTIPVIAATGGCCGTPVTSGTATCCGEPVVQVTDTTASGTASCCGDPATSGNCCN